MKGTFAPFVKERKKEIPQEKMKRRQRLTLSWVFWSGNSLCSSPPTIIRRDERKRCLISFENSSDRV